MGFFATLRFAQNDRHFSALQNDCHSERCEESHSFSKTPDKPDNLLFVTCIHEN
jgi:hypothetical protein